MPHTRWIEQRLGGRGCALIYDHYLVSKYHGFLLIMRYVQDSYRQPTLNHSDFGLHTFAQAAIKRRQRFIHQEKLWAEHQCTGECGALLLPSR